MPDAFNLTKEELHAELLEILNKIEPPLEKELLDTAHQEIEDGDSTIYLIWKNKTSIKGFVGNLMTWLEKKRMLRSQSFAFGIKEPHSATLPKS